jgi:hypothetical protein
MGYFTKILIDIINSKLIKKFSVTIGGENRKKRPRNKKFRDFSDNHDDDNWTY